jgi:glucose/arabinose dehydrogenase
MTMRTIGCLGVAVCTLLLTACKGNDETGGGGTTPPPATSNSLRVQPMTTVLSSPVFLTAPAGDVARLFVVEQGGLIRVLDLLSGAPRANPFLDVRGLITSGGERGLLGMAFDPGYATNGRFYIYYTDTAGNIVIARYQATPPTADVASSAGTILKTIAHPTNANHNGGMLAFGQDRCLYAGTGDGGGSGDPNNNAQNTNSLLGKILRLDPETGNACGTDNPFVSGGGAPEVWSVGLRNPWRFSFDRSTGVLYIGDVGQSQREEVDAVVGPSAGRGLNFGWNVMEGFLCFSPSTGCNTAGLTLPVLDYTHDAGACSITGGYVYRGTLNPAVNGTYFYADFCAGFVRSFQLQGTEPGSQATWPLLSPGGQIISFGEDARGELYIMTQAGSLFRIVPN